MRSKSKDKAQSVKVIRMNEEKRLGGYVTHAKYHPDNQFLKAKEKFKRPAYYGSTL